MDNTPNKPEEKPKKPDILISDVLKDGTMIEMVHDLAEGTTGFAVRRPDGSIGYQAQAEVNGVVHEALKPSSGIIRYGYISFPAKAEEYGSFTELLDDIQGFIHRYVDLSPEFERLCAIYTPFTWLYDRFEEAPYLRIIGEMGTGKSRLLKVMNALCYKALTLNGAITPAAMFRLITQYQPTLLLDEADFRNKSEAHDDVMKILNSGYNKGTPVVRCHSKTNEPEFFEVFGPKIVGSQRLMGDPAFESRCLSHTMQKTRRKDVPLNCDSRFHDEARSIRNRLLMLRFQEYHSLVPAPPSTINVHPRLLQIAGPLFPFVRNETDRALLQSYLERMNEDMRDSKMVSLPATILLSIEDFLNAGREVTYGLLAKTYNDDHRDQKSFTVNNISVGNTVKRKLKIPVRRTSREQFIDDTAEVREAIRMAKEEYGLTEDEDDKLSTNNPPIQIDTPF